MREPSRIPGTEPASSARRSQTLTLPMLAWPRPDRNVKRNGVHDVGADDAAREQRRIEPRQHRDADGAGADRGQRHERPQYEPEQKGRHGTRGHRDRGVLRGGLPASQHGMKSNGDGADDQGHGQHLADLRGEDVHVRLGQVEPREHRARAGQASRGQPSEDRPVDVGEAVVAPGGAGLGEGREQEVGSHRDGRRHADTGDEQRRRQRSGSHAGDADQEADDESAADDQMPVTCECVHGCGGLYRFLERFLAIVALIAVPAS